MAMINYADKVALNQNSNIADINKVKADDMNELKNAFNIQVAQGWYKTGISPTFTFVSWDSTTYTGVVNSNLDLTSYLSVGMKVKFTQSATVKFGIITAITSTQLTLFLGTDYSLNNSGISNAFYSMLKAPFGFPVNPNSWTLKSVLTSGATGNVGINWQNLGGLNVVCPIGVFKISGSAQVNVSGTGSGYFVTCISDSNNTSYDPEMRCRVSSGATTFEAVSFVPEKTIVNTSKTIYYLNHMFAFNQTNTSIKIVAPGAYALTSYIKVVCAYL